MKAEFFDLVFGHCTVPAALANEDYIIKRRDGLFAYQLVVVVDDIDQGITEVIRGGDLLQMTPRQQALFSLLGAKAPAYGHLPLAVTKPGFKLSKQNHATAVSQLPVNTAIYQALQFLGQQPPAELRQASADELLSWAIIHWQLAKVPALLEINSTEFK